MLSAIIAAALPKKVILKIAINAAKAVADHTDTPYDNELIKWFERVL